MSMRVLRFVKFLAFVAQMKSAISLIYSVGMLPTVLLVNVVIVCANMVSAIT